MRCDTGIVREQHVSMGVDTKAKTWGGGALEALDLRLREDFHELEHARHVKAVSGKVVLAQAASEESVGGVDRPSVSRGADTKVNTRGQRRT